MRSRSGVNSFTSRERMDSMLSILLVEDDPIFAEELQNRLLASVGDVAGV